jgi:hypothetical protein
MDPGAKYYQKDCINRQCPNCGVRNLDQSVIAGLLDNYGDDSIDWFQWETQHVSMSKTDSVGVIKKQMNKSGTVKNLVADLKIDLKTLGSHLHNASWQFAQFTNLKEKLPQEYIVMVLDFAENNTSTKMRYSRRIGIIVRLQFIPL